MHSPAPQPRKLLYRVTEAMEMLSLSRSQLYEQMAASRLRSVKQGRSRLIPDSAIREYVQLLITEAEQEASYDATA